MNTIPDDQKPAMGDISNPLLRAALHYASKGIPVFPCGVNAKEPLIPLRDGGHGVKDATIDPEQIKAWWKAEPNANIGGAAGFLMDVMDVDSGGADTFRSKDNLKSIKTMVKTPSGGRHVYYAVSEIPLKNAIKPKSLPGLDCRTKGGYVLMPPSYVIDPVKGYEGAYEFMEGHGLNGELPAFPKWALPAFRRDAGPEPKESQVDIASVADGLILDGSKHGQLRDAIFKLRKFDLPIDLTKEIILRCIEKVPDDRFRKPKAQVIQERMKDIEDCYRNKDPDPRHAYQEDQEDAQEFTLTDIGLAERFAHEYQDKIRYIPERETWLEVSQDIWGAQTGGDACAYRKAMEMGKAISAELTAQAVEIVPGDDKGLAKIQDALHKKAARMETTATISNIVKLAKPQTVLHMAPDALDADPWLIGTLDGVVDLRTLDIVAQGHTRGVTRCIPHRWTPERGCEEFDEFLAQIMCYKPNLVKLMKCWLGYCLVGHNDSQKFMIWYGDRGRNGKTTLWNIVSHVLGKQYSAVLDKRLILQTINPAQFALANIEGTRAVFASEPQRNSRLNTEWLKEFSGGEEMSAERKGIQAYQFKPAAKLTLALNHLPTAQFDDMLMDRMIAVPFEQSFYDKGDPRWREGDLPRDEKLEHNLKANIPGIIGFMARCCLEYQESGLIQPAESRILAANFEAENDTIGQWLADRCEVVSDDRTKTTDLFSNYQNFCQSLGIHFAGRMNGFSKRLLREPGLTEVRPSNVSYIVGLAIKSHTTQRLPYKDSD